MSDQKDEPLPKLRMVPPETPEELIHRLEREQRACAVQREDRLGECLAPFRVGSVPYLNAAPLVRGIEDQVIRVVPSELARMLAAEELDAALVSLAEVVLQERYDVLDGIGICSLGEVQSVLLLHRQPLEEIREVYCDPASISGFNLMRVLLAERGVKPEFKTLSSDVPAPLPDNVLLIGDRALDYFTGPHTHEIFDLGFAWFEMTGLPFTFAVWALRRGVENSSMRRQLREARDFGLDTIDSIIRDRTEYTMDFRRDYLTWHIHYHLGTDEKRGIAEFVRLLNSHGLGPAQVPHFVA
jgi:predicted solute-binding protein